MSTALRFPLTSFFAIVAAAAAMRAAPARAAEVMLRGPHPFLKDNEVSARLLFADGIGSAPTGTKIALEYAYKAAHPLWADIQLNLQHGGCQSAPAQAPCGVDSGDVVETLGGIKWKWATTIPLVPFVDGLAGMVFVFPDSAQSALGFTARVAGGASYYFFDWLGVGAQAGFSLGRVSYTSSFPGSPTYSVFDIGGGVELQF